MHASGLWPTCGPSLRATRSAPSPRRGVPPAQEANSPPFPALYAAIAAGLGIAGAVELIAPGVVTAQLSGFSGPSFLPENTVRVAAAFAPLAACQAAALAAAAADESSPGRFQSDTYARLELSLWLASVAGLSTCVAAAAAGVGSLPLLGASAALAVPTAAVTTASLRRRGLSPAVLANAVLADAVVRP